MDGDEPARGRDDLAPEALLRKSYRAARRIGIPSVLVDDAVQEAFRRLLTKDLPADCHFAFILATLKHLPKELGRRATRSAILHQRLGEESGKCQDPVAQLEEREEIGRMAAVLSRIGRQQPRHHAIFIELMHGATTEEVMDTFRVSRANVYAIRSRVRKELRGEKP